MGKEIKTSYVPKNNGADGFYKNLKSSLNLIHSKIHMPHIRGVFYLCEDG